MKRNCVKVLRNARREIKATKCSLTENRNGAAMAPELIIFDCDGVLIDSETLSLRALLETLTLIHGVTLTMQDVMSRFMGKSEAFEIADLEAKNGIKVSDEYLAKKKQRRLQLFEESLVPLPGITALLDTMPMKKCVASSSVPERLQHSLELVGLWDRLAPHIFSSTQVKNGKPAPDLFLFAAQQMQTPTSACLVIEDSVAGVRAAKAANMRVYGFIGGTHCDAAHGDLLRQEGAEAVFAHMDEIAEALRDC